MYQGLRNFETLTDKQQEYIKFLLTHKSFQEAKDCFVAMLKSIDNKL